MIHDTPAEKVKTNRFLRGLFRDQKKWLGAALGASVLFSVSQLLISLVVKRFMDEAIVTHSWRRVLQLSLMFFLAITAEALTGFAQRFTTRIAAERAIRDLRNRVFSRLLIFSDSTLSSYSSGKAVTRVVNDVMSIGLGFVQGSDIVRAPLVLIAMLSYLFYLNWQLTLVCLILFPLLALVGDKLAKSARRNQRRLQQSIEKISIHIVEALKGLRMAHVFEQTPLLRQEFGEKTSLSYGHLIKLARIEESINPITKLLGAFVGTIVISYAGWLVSHDRMTAGAFTAYIVTAARLIDPFGVLNNFNVRFQQMAAAADRVREVLDEPIDPIGVSQQARLTLAAGPRLIRQGSQKVTLRFEDVSFRYPNRSHEDINSLSPWALKNINFELTPGKKMALVGRSGSGKTTLSLLALRLIDPTQGKVTLDKRDTRDWDIAEYRSHFSYVSQDVFLFNRSIRENMLFARPGARDAEIWQALEKAHIAELVKAMPRQLDTLVAFDGADFSGGEKQRLSLARAFLRDSPLLILDEATSQLDAFSESAVQSAIHELVVDRSVIVIAHRLSTVREMDTVAVFEAGEIVEMDAPQKLLNEKAGAFYELWSKQHGQEPV